jgi:O-methyltransferase
MDMTYACNHWATLARLRGLLGGVVVRVAKVIGGDAETGGCVSGTIPFDPETQVVWDRVRSRTMTNIERIDALREAIEYIHANSIPGDIVECGVWRGGSMMAVALTLLRIGGNKRLWLYDTFSGMTPPGIVDRDFQGRAAEDLLAAEDPETGHIWCKSSLSGVRTAMAETGYPTELIEFVAGSVENTIPLRAPKSISLLRLDTDWFESTYHELRHLWPRLADGGVLIIDDYGYWAGARRAVHQYFDEVGVRPFLHRIDGNGRLVLKTARD